MILSWLFHTWYGALIFLVLTGHLTIACTSIYMHRAMAHGGIHLHPIVSWSMRIWLWVFTGMSTLEWVAVHRKHHAFVETEQDPHSPVIHGWANIMFFGVKHYRKAYQDPETIAKFSKGCPNDWFERNIFIKLKIVGPILLGVLDVLLFGKVLGPLVWMGQALWVPFWAAGVVNGLGHTIGYRNYKVQDASRNLIFLGLLLSGEELHNNHHKFPASAKFSKRWFELDMGWVYIQALRGIRLAKVKIVQTALADFKTSKQEQTEIVLTPLKPAPAV